jgi:hypothetical protein
MKKLGEIDFRVFHNSIYLFSPIVYSLIDIDEIIFCPEGSRSPLSGLISGFDGG